METHDDVFIWLLEQLAETTLEREQTVGINATTLEANAAMCRIVRRDTGDDYEAFVKCLAVASRVETLTAAGLRAIRPETQENEVEAVAEIAGLESRGERRTIAETRTWK